MLQQESKPFAVDMLEASKDLGLSLRQLERVVDGAVASCDQQRLVLLELLQDSDKLDLGPASGVPGGVRGLLLKASLKYRLGDVTQYLLQKDVVSDSGLVEAFNFAVQLKDGQALGQLMGDCPRSRHVFKTFIHQQRKEDGGCDKVNWLYNSLYIQGEKSLALHVFASYFSMNAYVEQFNACSDTTYKSRLFREAIEECVRSDCADCFIAMCTARLDHSEIDLSQSGREEFAFACFSVVRGKRLGLISSLCEKKMDYFMYTYLSVFLLLLNIIIDNKQWDMLFSVSSVCRQHDIWSMKLFEIVERVMVKMLFDCSTWPGIAPALEHLIKGSQVDLEKTLKASDFEGMGEEQWMTSMSTMKQWCLDNNHIHLTFALAVVTEDWPLVETLVSTQSSLNLKARTFIQTANKASKLKAYAVGAALLKMVPLNDENVRYSLIRFDFKEFISDPFAKVYEGQGLLDWALALQNRNETYIQEHHQRCDNPTVLNNILKMAHFRPDPVVVKELLPRCTDLATLQESLKYAVQHNQVDLAKLLMKRVDPGFGANFNGVQTEQWSLLFEAVYVSDDVCSEERLILIKLICLMILSGLSTVQRHMPFVVDSLYDIDDFVHHCPLLEAIESGRLRIVKLMLACGAFTHQKLRQVQEASCVRQDLDGDQVWETGSRYIEEAAATPSRLEHLARLAVSHSVGCRPGRSERIDALPLPEPLKDLVRFKDVLQADMDEFEKSEEKDGI